MALARIQMRPARVTVPLTEKEKLRRHMERAVERLIAAMDALDGDPDLEDVCEDEGAQCDDEGHREAYTAPDDDWAIRSFIEGDRARWAC